MDNIDVKILDLLQKDAEITIQNISEQIHLSTTPCWKRINRLKESGYIKKTVAIIDQKKVGLNTVAFVFITIDNHNQEKLIIFSKVIEKMPEIVECHRMSGTIDYLLKVIVNDIDGYNIFYNKLISDIGFLNITSNFVMENMKSTSEIPINI